MKGLKSSIGLQMALSMSAVLLFWRDPGYALEPAQILSWVAGQMQVDAAVSLPEVRYVDKAGLQSAFARANHNTLQRWQGRYGRQEAQKFWSTYLKELTGMFDPETTRIYIGRFLAPCRQQAILAHEIAHYLQQRKHGRVKTGTREAEYVQLMREMQAGRIEQRYSALFCTEENSLKTESVP